jgi:hypothetical protein
VAVDSAEGLDPIGAVQAARISSMEMESPRGSRVIGLTRAQRSVAVPCCTASCAS